MSAFDPFLLQKSAGYDGRRSFRSEQPALIRRHWPFSARAIVDIAGRITSKVAAREGAIIPFSTCRTGICGAMPFWPSWFRMNFQWPHARSQTTCNTLVFSSKPPPMRAHIVIIGVGISGLLPATQAAFLCAYAWSRSNFPSCTSRNSSRARSRASMGYVPILIRRALPLIRQAVYQTLPPDAGDTNKKTDHQFVADFVALSGRGKQVVN
jgi:hypothetical protein